MEEQEATKELARLVEVLESALAEAEAFAAEHGLGFRFEPAYGMGGYFQGDPVEAALDECEVGWYPSSHSC
jgi:sugar phosphate isomerase/epimerase